LAAFSAESVAEELGYTFTYKVGDKVIPGPSGVIDEPTDRQIAKFLTGVKKVVKESEDKLPSTADPANPASVTDALDDLNPEDVVSLMGKMAQLYADLCSGSPSKAEILALPMRRRQAFYAWLQQEVMSPEALGERGRAPRCAQSPGNPVLGPPLPELHRGRLGRSVVGPAAGLPRRHVRGRKRAVQLPGRCFRAA